MAYAAQSDLIPQRITMKDAIGLTDDNHTGQLNTTIVANALEEASGIIDSFCRSRYATPLQASDSLTTLTLDIATYRLFARRREIAVSESIAQTYKDAIAFLKLVAAGQAQLDQPAGNPPQQTNAGPAIAAGRQVPKDPDVRFNDRNLEGYS